MLNLFLVVALCTLIIASFDQLLELWSLCLEDCIPERILVACGVSCAMMFLVYLNGEHCTTLLEQI